MKFTPILNENLEIKHFEAYETTGAITRNVIVTPGAEYFHIKEKIYNGKEEIYFNDMVIGKDVLNAIQEIF